MFERNRVDRPHEAEKVVHHVALVLTDDTEVCGRTFVSQGRTLFEDLNTAGGFAELESYSGDRVYINKAMIRSARALQVPKADQLTRRSRQNDTFDPKTVLQIADTADRETVRAAYHRLAKLYHPDRYTMMDLPAEVLDYISAMAVRLNAAYAALQEMPKPTKATAANNAMHG